MEEKLLNVSEVSLIVGASIQTISSWYKWKGLHPDHALAKLIPEFTRIGNKRTRYWKKEDAWALRRFRDSIPQGRNGVMGDVTQKYVKKN